MLKFGWLVFIDVIPSSFPGKQQKYVKIISLTVRYILVGLVGSCLCLFYRKQMQDAAGSRPHGLSIPRRSGHFTLSRHMKTTDGGLPTSARPTRWKAEPLYRRAADGFEAQLGPNHTDTLSCLNSFAFLLKKQGKLDEAGHSSLGNRQVFKISQV